MRLLLDTHIWLWGMLQPTKLTSRVAKALQKDDAELWLSPISVWELSMLVVKGRVELETNIDDWVHEALSRAPLNEAPLTNDIALATRQIELPHPDPVDHFLAATAKILNLTLVTADRRLIDSRFVPTLANR